MSILKFAFRLDQYRQFHDLSVSELAQKVGIPTERMEDLLEGKHEPRAGVIVKIERALGVVFKPEDFEENGIP